MQAPCPRARVRYAPADRELLEVVFGLECQAPHGLRRRNAVNGLSQVSELQIVAYRTSRSRRSKG